MDISGILSDIFEGERTNIDHLQSPAFTQLQSVAGRAEEAADAEKMGAQNNNIPRLSELRIKDEYVSTRQPQDGLHQPMMQGASAQNIVRPKYVTPTQQQYVTHTEPIYSTPTQQQQQYVTHTEPRTKLRTYQGMLEADTIQKQGTCVSFFVCIFFPRVI